MVEAFYLVQQTPSWYIRPVEYQEDAGHLSDDAVELTGIDAWNTTWWLPWVDWSVTLGGIGVSLWGLWMVLGPHCKSTTHRSTGGPGYFLVGLFFLGPAWLVFHFYVWKYREIALNDVHLAVLCLPSCEYASEDPSWKDDTTIDDETLGIMVPLAFLWCFGCCVVRWFQIASDDIDRYYEIDVQEWETRQEDIEMKRGFTTFTIQAPENTASLSPRAPPSSLGQRVLTL